MRSLGANDVGAGCTAILAIGYLWVNRSYPLLSEYGLSSGFLPLLLGIILFILSFIWFISNRIKGKDSSWREMIPSRGPIIITLISIVWSLIFEITGTIISLFLLTAGIWVVYERLSWRSSLLGALALSLVTYILFSTLVGVPLPKGWISFF